VPRLGISVRAPLLVRQRDHLPGISPKKLEGQNNNLPEVRGFSAFI
jgi:hypothetical protein